MPSTLRGSDNFDSASQLSTVRVQGSAGNGSINTAIPRFASVVDSSGGDITYADSATLGASFTINTTGVYAMQYTDSWSGGGMNIGISKNSTQLTTDVGSITAANRVALSTSGAASVPVTAVNTIQCAAGDVIRPHASASVPNSALKQFTITRVR